MQQLTRDVTEPIEIWFALPHHNNASMQAWVDTTNLNILGGLTLLGNSPNWAMYGVIGRLDQAVYHTINQVFPPGANEVIFNGTKTIRVLPS